MQDSYYSAEQIAQLLHLHIKTVQRYMREGRLPAVKLGKSWRVTEAGLRRFAQGEAGAETATRPLPTERTRASAVLDIAVSGAQEAQRITRLLGAAMHSQPPEFAHTSLHTQYLEEPGTLRLSLWGNAAFMAAVFESVTLLLSQQEPEHP